MISFNILYILAACIYLYMGYVTITNDSKSKTNRILMIICFIMFIWSVLSAATNAAENIYIAAMFRRYAVFAWSFFYSTVLIFYIVLTKRESILKNPLAYMILYIPAIISIYLYYFYQPLSAADIVKTSLGWTYGSFKGKGWLWNNFLNIYYVSYTTISALLILTWGIKSKIKRERKQAKIIGFTLIATFITGTATDVVFPFLGVAVLPPTAVIAALIHVYGILFSMKKYRLMDLNPENIILDFLKIIDEGLIILNQDGIITGANQGAIKLLCYSGRIELVGKPIDVIFPKDNDMSDINNTKSKELELLTKNKYRVPVILHSLTLKDNLGDIIGTLVSFQDMSGIKEAHRELKKAYDNLELKVLERTNELTAEIEARILMEETIKKYAYYDALTNLPNRRLLNDRLERAIFDAERDSKLIGILFIDIDSFKMVNDSLGHSEGDELLKQVACRLTDITRKADTVARVGGDEFVVMMRNIKFSNIVRKISGKILDSFKEPFYINNKELFTTVSIGVSIYPLDGSDGETLIKNADTAMYKAKNNGKNNIELYTPDLKNNAIVDMNLRNSLYRALERNELELFYQPQVNSKTNRIVGLEALLRWNHPELGMVSPVDFIPIAERSGLIVPIGEWVIKTASIQNKAWQDMGLPSIPVAVNISVKQLYSSKFVEKIEEILKETGLNPNYLELEITESVLMQDIEFITRILKRIKKIGLRISIDDFGIEYSSLRYLKHLPLDRLKIPMAFIQGLNKNEKDDNITKTIISLTENLKLDVIAEGVESKQQLDFLQTNNCEVIQGYYFYRPMPSSGIEKLLEISGK